MKFISVFMLILLSGCATQGKSGMQYTDGKQEKVENEVTVDGSSSVLWDKLVGDLAKSFYVINNIDKESRIINVSFNSNSPTEFVDCGQTSRSYSEGENIENYEYDVAGNSSFKVALKSTHPKFSLYSQVIRNSSLDGRANIYLAPDTSNSKRTNVSVNARYIVTSKVSQEIYSKHFMHTAYSHAKSVPSQTYTYIFQTNRPSTTDAGGGVKVVCSSKGKLEREILDIVQ